MILKQTITKTVLVFCATALFASSMALAEASQSGSATSSASFRPDIAALKIDLAGRQRMLTQRMAKAACFWSNGIHSGYHHQQIVAMHALFVQTHHALLKGDAALGLPAEKNPESIAALQDVDALWAVFERHLQPALSDVPLSDTQLITIAHKSQELLKMMNTAVGIIERANAVGNMDPSLAKAINLSGRQRMLSQKASLEFCMVAHDLDKSSFLKKLAATFQTFDISHQQLVAGDETAGIPPAPTSEIAHQLYAVSLDWAPVRTAIDAVLQTAQTDDTQLEYVAYVNDRLFKDLNETVKLYTGMMN